ncbi:glycosyltransferase family 47 protein [Candidatus Pelagibacter sp.]|nr:glycosyltransferase family 47 protein [Candidatus Pelagibacter sp.]
MKLLWNTNKNLPVGSNLGEERTIFWGNYHFVNSYPWILNLLSKLEIEIINDTQNLDENESLIIVDHMISTKESFYFDLSNKVKKIFLIHLGDEGGAEKKDLVYPLCEHIWRTFSLPMFKNFKNVTSIPIGYKCDPIKDNINILKRNYKWSFLGTTHGSSRYDLLNKHKNIMPNFINLTEDFSGKKSMDTNNYYKILNNSIFAPIPHGYFHPETYRLYEALEAGCIPIIENPFQFFDNFLPNNPLPSVNSWEDSSTIIKKYLENKKDIEILGNKINDWWTQHKENLKETFLIIKNV